MAVWTNRENIVSLSLKAGNNKKAAYNTNVNNPADVNYAIEKFWDML